MQTLIDRVKPSGISSSTRSPLTDTEYDKFRRSQRCDANIADQAPIIDVFLGHGGSIATYEESLFWLDTDEAAPLKFSEQKIFDYATNVHPSGFVIGFKLNKPGLPIKFMLEPANVVLRPM